jgi:NAD(P)H-hydrate epimerase
LSLSKDFCDKHDCTLILKGAYSIISNKNQQYVNSRSVPSLGVAGSGDILSGIIGGLIARGLSVFDSSLVSVYLHTKAGKLWEDKHEISSGMIASEISSFLPKALSKLTNS